MPCTRTQDPLESSGRMARRRHVGRFLGPQNRERVDWVLEPEHDKLSELEFGKAERNCGKHLHTYILNAKPLFSEFQ